MSYDGETAYITGGASGIARSLATHLVSQGMKIFIADWNFEGAEQVAKDLNTNANAQVAWTVKVDVSDWESQRQGFEAAVQELGRIDYVFPIAGISELPWLPKQLSKKTGAFEKPNLKVFEVNANGAIYSTALAITQFRRQQPNKHGFRGKREDTPVSSLQANTVVTMTIVCSVSSACGFYYIPALPIYTAAKHAIIGFTRSFGKYLPKEKITLNTICPTIVATGISTGTFYQQAGERGLLVTVEALIEAFEYVIANDVSGEAIEVLPGNEGYRIKEGPDFTNEHCRQSVELARAPEHRAWKLHEPIEI